MTQYIANARRLTTPTRIEKNLKIVSKTLLVDLPDDQSFTVQEFVDMQRKHIVTRSRLLQVRLNLGHRVDESPSLPLRAAVDSRVAMKVLVSYFSTAGEPGSVEFSW